MAQAIPEEYLDLFHKKAFANLATIKQGRFPTGYAGVDRLRRQPCSGEFRERPPQGQEHGTQLGGCIVYPRSR
jgi:hypothetical protein